MPTVINSGKIKNQISGEMIDFELLHKIDFILSHKADIEWSKFNLSLMQHVDTVAGGDPLLLRTLLDECQFEDSHWRWLNKAMTFTGDDYEWFYFVAENEVQGICIFYHPKKSKVDSDNIFYIEYLATAPWNRQNRLGNLKFKGIGSTLLRESLLYSIKELGYRPGFSLHSLPQATTYYEKIGMLNFGPDPNYHNLNYLEMEKNNSEVFANG